MSDGKVPPIELLKRRDFLSGAMGAGGALGALGASSPLSAAQATAKTYGKAATQTDYDVIVVGGGFAGVTAARDCKKSGLRTLVLEARNRLGGRVFDVEWRGHRIEMGGTWLYWSHPGVWSEINRYGLTVDDTPGFSADRLIVRGDKYFLDTEYAKVADEIKKGGEAYFSGAQEEWPRPWDSHFSRDQLVAKDSLTAADRLKQITATPLQQHLIQAFMEACCNCPMEQGSYLEIARWYALNGWNWAYFNESISRYRIKEGTGELVRRIASDGGAEIKLSSPVRGIEQNADVARVTTSDNQIYSAKAIIMAVPMNCLASVAFEPALSAGKISASRERHTGAGVKFFAEIKGRHGKLAFAAPAKYGAGYGFTYEELPNSTLIVGFGADAKTFDPNDKQSVQKVLRQFIPEAEVIACTSYGWNEDPFSLGTYASYRPGKLIQWIDEMGRREGRIHMAGADVSEGWRGFIEGAISKGAQVAHQVVMELA